MHAEPRAPERRGKTLGSKIGSVGRNCHDRQAVRHILFGNGMEGIRSLRLRCLLAGGGELKVSGTYSGSASPFLRGEKVEGGAEDEVREGLSFVTVPSETLVMIVVLQVIQGRPRTRLLFPSARPLEKPIDCL